jgi:uncharacterized protein (TIGR00661 family)
MARIICSMCGHGRGHAMRIRAAVEKLKDDHDFFLYCPGDAYEQLSRLYQNSSVHVFEMKPALRFVYHNNKVHLARTIWHALKYLTRLPANVRWLEREIRRHNADIALIDLEPTLARAARRTGIVYLSLDNQHRFVVNQTSGMPWRLRLWAFLISLYVKAVCSGQTGILVSAFYHRPIRRRYRRRVRQLGPLLRPAVLNAQTRDAGHITAYFRDSIAPSVIETLKSSSREVRIYGLTPRPDDGPLRFKPISETGFVEDLASCHAVVATAGHQLISEILYLRKPSLLIPEPGQFEQMTNAHMVAEANAGLHVEAGEFTPETLQQFLDNVGKYRPEPPELGNHTIKAAIESFITAPETQRSEYAQTKSTHYELDRITV